jgi:hypothetical protein
VAEPFLPAAWDRGCPEDWILAAPCGGHVLYRVVGEREARLYDFQSWRDRDAEKDRARRYPDDPWIDYVCISMFEAEALAVGSANNFPAYIAEVELKRNNGFSLARTDVNILGHYSVWGDPEKLLLAVVGAPVRYAAAP